MKIKSFTIKNFKCLGPTPLAFDFSQNILVLIGENNVGKSSVLQALDLFFSNKKTIDANYFLDHLTDESHAIQIDVLFDSLSDEERAHQALRGAIKAEGTPNEVWHLRKRFFYEDGKCQAKYSAIVLDEADAEREVSPWGRVTVVDDLFFEEKMQPVFIEAVKNIRAVTEGSGKSKSTLQDLFQLVVSRPLSETEAYTNLVEQLKQYRELFGDEHKLAEIRTLEENLSQKLSQVIAASGHIQSTEIPPENLIPEPQLRIDDGRNVETVPEHQGHGLQRTVIFVLLEMLASQKSPAEKLVGPRNLILIEEPEIYMHPQMERRFADALYAIAASGVAQVICTTHSPVFVRLSDSHKALVRLVRARGSAEAIQVQELFQGEEQEERRKRLRMLLNFDPNVTEAFFTKKNVLVEGDTEVATFTKTAELLGCGNRDVTIVNCRGKWTIADFQEVLNHFQIPYRVVHDQDEKAEDEGANGRILSLLPEGEEQRRMLVPDIEGVLGIPTQQRHKPFIALTAVETFHQANTLEAQLGDVVRFIYEST